MLPLKNFDRVINSFNTSGEENQEQRIGQAEEPIEPYSHTAHQAVAQVDNSSFRHMHDQEGAQKIQQDACDEKEPQDGSRSECSSFEETSSDGDLNDESAIDYVAPSIEQSYRESAFPG